MPFRYTPRDIFLRFLIRAKAADLDTIPRQPGRDLAAAEERILREQLVDRAGYACLRLIRASSSALAGSGRQYSVEDPAPSTWLEARRRP